MTNPIFVDLADQAEDQRIAIIGDMVTRLGKIAAVVVADEPGKAERYVRKVTKRYPAAVVLKQIAGPIKGMITIKFGPVGARN